MLCLPEDTYQAVNALAVVPLDDRPSPREGDIFSPEVGRVFRNRITRALRQYEYNPMDLVAEMNEEELVAPTIVVNEPLPWGAGNSLFSGLLDTLPPLPEDLEYRLVGRDLALVDLRAKVVVDVLRSAVPMY